MTSPAPMTPFFYCLSSEQLQDMLDQAAQRGAALALAHAEATEQAPTYYTVDEAAALLKCDPRNIYAAIKNGELKAKHIGRAVRISAQALSAWGES